MGADSRVITGLILVGEALSGWLAWRHYRSLAQLEDVGGETESHVSIIVPARNEEHRLPALLASLSSLDYGDYEVVVVDDASTDRTAAVAAASRARVIRIERLPQGWTGKAYACQQGANSTRGEWLLFTDADTVHTPRSLRVAVIAATRTNSALLSLLARQRCDSFWEWLLLPYAYALYFVGARRINTAQGPAVANGQYMLVRRDAYDHVGGHSAVGGEIIEDVRLAAVLESRGYRVTLLRGEAYLSVRMYPTFSALWEGFAKNAFRFVRASPRSGLPTALAGLIFLAGATRMVGANTRTRAVLAVTQAAALRPWYALFGTPRATAFMSPLAALVFQFIALDSLRRTLLGRTAWKGRRY